MSDAAMDSAYRLVLETSESTVCAEAPLDVPTSDAYQSEAQLEDELIATLCSQAYERLRVVDEAGLLANLRRQLERLNRTTFSDAEWDRLFHESIANGNDGIVEKTRRIQQGSTAQALLRDDGTTRNVYLLDKEDIHNNSLQVMNQYETDEGAHKNRYDVTILVNGLPLVHIELKRRGIDIREAFNQIDRYQRDSFWSGCGLYQYVQIFVISNGTHTKYYSNTTRSTHVREEAGSSRPAGKTSSTFEFTSWWADSSNRPIADLIPFARTFLAKHAILAILCRYCVFTAEDDLLVMRPYQIVATERILNRILVSENDRKRLGTPAAGGYVWHATGSGKTLTSFKTAQLACQMDGIDKVLFVVDRQDLDFQTMKEYDRFEKGAVNSNRSTAVLTRQLSDPNAHIIVTTIQKLSTFVAKNTTHPIYDSHIVIIFDECHRSQFGSMHAEITRRFHNYHLFGFTGTPIFAENAGAGHDPTLRTTEQAFGDQLHRYTVVDAIRDRNVLPFRVDYVSTVSEGADIRDGKVYGIDRQAVLMDPERIETVAGYVLDHFDQKTKRRDAYKLKDKRVMGFNSIFAADSIEAAKAYYVTFKRLQKERGGEPLKIAIDYSYAANEAENTEGILPEETLECEGLDKTARDFLDGALADYNAMFGTTYSTDGASFEGYYKDVSKRMKNRDLDLLIVVNMFLTGFDAKTLNTLWVDKNLRQHGLIQAFSRTNRILNSVKTFGNIVCFRDLSDEVDHAIALFGDKDASGTVLLKPYGEYLDAYREKVAALHDRFPDPHDIPASEDAQRDLILLYGAILRLRNILTSFDRFSIDDMLTPRELQDYQSTYVELYHRWRDSHKADQERINDDVVFEVELVKQVEVNIDYILMLVEKYHGSDCQDKEILADVDRAMAASLELRDKRDLIDAFVASLTPDSDVSTDWKRFIDGKRKRELDQIIEEERLKPEATRTFVRHAFEQGGLDEGGTSITKVLPPVSRFAPDNAYEDMKERVLARLKVFFSRFNGLG